MKISIITLHRFDNVGSCLQACALSNYLQKQGNYVELLDYVPFYKEHYEPIKVLALILNYKNVRARMKKIGIALNENTCLSKKILNYNKLKVHLNEFDLLISGGDQIWNPMYPNYYDDAFYYFGMNKPKIAYGSSVSVSSLTTEQVKFLKERINSYYSVNVREKKTVELFCDNHINDNTHYVIDPVFLPDIEFYNEMIKKAQVSDIIDDDKYILLYHLDPGKELDNIISQIRKFTGYKTISIIGNRKYWYSDCYLKDYGPYDFLWLIKKAKYVLTGSFHAICFSLMFKTPFVVQLPEKSPNRLSNILKEVNMLDRIIDKNNPVETICNSPIKPEVYLTLAKMIESSKLQLNSDVALIKGENND